MKTGKCVVLPTIFIFSKTNLITPSSFTVPRCKVVPSQAPRFLVYQVYHYSDYCAWSQCAYQFCSVFHTFSCNRHVLLCLELKTDTILHNLDYLHAWPSTCHGAFDAVTNTSQTGRIIVVLGINS